MNKYIFKSAFQIFALIGIALPASRLRGQDLAKADSIRFPYNLTFGISHDSARNILSQDLSKHLRLDTTYISGFGTLVYDKCSFFGHTGSRFQIGFRSIWGLISLSVLFQDSTNQSPILHWEQIYNDMITEFGESSNGKKSLDLLAYLRESNSDDKIIQAILNEEISLLASWDFSINHIQFKSSLTITETGDVKFFVLNPSAIK